MYIGLYIRLPRAPSHQVVFLEDLHTLISSFCRQKIKDTLGGRLVLAPRRPQPSRRLSVMNLEDLLDILLMGIPVRMVKTLHVGQWQTKRCAPPALLDAALAG